MKKLIAMILCLVMVMAMFAACGKEKTPATEAATEKATEEVTQAATDPVNDEATEEVTEEAPADSPSNDALLKLEAIWALYGEDEKFPAMGGDMVNVIDNAPGVFTVDDEETLTSFLLVPAEQQANVTEIASLFHLMNLNHFTCGMFRINGDTAAFADAIYNSVKGNQWMCGFPESVLVSIVDGEYVLMAFGINAIMEPFAAKLQEAYPEAQIVYNEAIA